MINYIYCTRCDSCAATPPRPSEISEKKIDGEAIFDIPFMIQSHAESMKKILGALLGTTS